MNLDKIFQRHEIELDYVIQIGLDYSSPFEEAFAYDANGARRVIYFDLLPHKVARVQEDLDRKRQKIALAAITPKHRQPLRIFVDHISFALEGKSLDCALIEQKINPLDITLVYINVDSGNVGDILKSCDMLFKLGLEYLIVKNKYYYEDVIKYGFIRIDESLFYNDVNPL